MTHRSQLLTGSLALLGLAILIASPPLRGQEPRVRQVTAVTPGDLRTWDSQMDRMIRSRELEVRRDREDTLMPGRRHTRYTQTVKGVPVYGADIARALAGADGFHLRDPARGRGHPDDSGLRQRTRTGDARGAHRCGAGTRA